jgi:N-acetyl-anhydromuramyl-L-alanine amidase AmpD
MKIDRSLRLPPDEYKVEVTKKNLIVLHHTVGASATSTFEWWLTDPKPIGTAYLIARDGTVHEVFPPEGWAYHLGYGSRVDERRSIGIELASEGALLERGGRLYCYDKLTERTRFTGGSFDLGYAWRGYRYFDVYEEAQLAALIELVGDLTHRFNVPPAVLQTVRTGQPSIFHVNHRLFNGIVGHAHLRPEKTDVHPDFDWNRLVNELGLQRI